MEFVFEEDTFYYFDIVVRFSGVIGLMAFLLHLSSRKVCPLLVLKLGTQLIAMWPVFLKNGNDLLTFFLNNSLVGISLLLKTCFPRLVSISNKQNQLVYEHEVIVVLFQVFRNPTNCQVEIYGGSFMLRMAFFYILDLFNPYRAKYF